MSGWKRLPAPTSASAPCVAITPTSHGSVTARATAPATAASRAHCAAGGRQESTRQPMTPKIAAWGCERKAIPSATPAMAGAQRVGGGRSAAIAIATSAANSPSPRVNPPPAITQS